MHLPTRMRLMLSCIRPCVSLCRTPHYCPCHLTKRYQVLTTWALEVIAFGRVYRVKYHPVTGQRLTSLYLSMNFLNYFKNQSCFPHHHGFVANLTPLGVHSGFLKITDFQDFFAFFPAKGQFFPGNKTAAVAVSVLVSTNLQISSS